MGTLDNMILHDLWDHPDVVIDAHGFRVIWVNNRVVLMQRQVDVITSIGPFDTLDQAVTCMMDIHKTS